jgi:predicted transcriptional regulator of viral defense system
MKLPKIYEHFSYGQIFTIDEAREKLETTGNTLRKRLSELSSRNYIHPIRQGLYRVARPGEMPEARRSDPFHVAVKVTAAGYVAFQTALELHAGVQPAEGGNVFLVSASKFNSFQFEGRLFFWCQNPDAEGVEQVDVMAHGIVLPVRVTTFEKSIVDCLKRTAHSPTFPRLVELCVAAGREPDWTRLVKLASECHVAALFNRLGYFVDRMSLHWSVPEAFFADAERRMSRKVTDWPLESVEENTDEADDLALRARWKVQFPEAVTISGSRPAVTTRVGATARPPETKPPSEREDAESAQEIPWFHA